MTRAALEALEKFWQEEKPSFSGEDTLFVNGHIFGDEDTQSYLEHVRFVQFRKREFDELFARGVRVSHEIPQSVFKHVIILGTSSRRETLGLLFSGINRLALPGQVHISLENSFGADSLRKTLRQGVPALRSFSKRKSKVLSFSQDDIVEDSLIKKWEEYAYPRKRAETNMVSLPGLFSWREIDCGSQLLLSALPEKLPGKIADLGCGYGYLAKAILADGKEPESIALYDHDIRAVRCSEKNLKPWEEKCSLHFLWQDVQALVPEEQFDWVISNPPIHQQGETSLPLGMSFMKKASQILKPTGGLFLVANRSLPYEPVLANLFRSYSILKEESGFKVLFASHPISTCNTTY